MNIQILQKHKTSIGIISIWLFNLTALIGIYAGYQEWFMSKTFLNMLVYTLFLGVLFPLDTKKQWALFMGCFSIGMISEWIGVHTSILFGNYEYGDHLGFKIFGVPFFIGMNWAVLSLISEDIAKRVTKNRYLIAVFASCLMLGLDMIMEMGAPSLDFWEFSNGVVPLKNYLSWFLIALLIQLWITPKMAGGNFKFSLHLLGSQYVFFAVYLLL